jgi:hypothetical protein
MKGVTLSHGRYYLVTQAGVVNGRRKQKWISLTTNYEESVRMAEELKNPQTVKIGTKLDIKKFAIKAFRSCARRAETRGMEISITQQWVEERLENISYKCEVTGLDFDLVMLSNSHGKPFAPSIDRINSSQGYTQSNTRIVCVATNYAMNAWGETVLAVIANQYVSKQNEKGRSRIETQVEAHKTVSRLGKPENRLNTKENGHSKVAVSL